MTIIECIQNAVHLSEPLNHFPHYFPLVLCISALRRTKQGSWLILLSRKIAAIKKENLQSVLYPLPLCSVALISDCGINAFYCATICATVCKFWRGATLGNTSGHECRAIFAARWLVSYKYRSDYHFLAKQKNPRFVTSGATFFICRTVKQFCINYHRAFVAYASIDVSVWDFRCYKDWH